VLIVWIGGFLVGTTTHVLDLVGGGLDTYAGFPAALRWYWVSLTLLDPLTVVLLALRRRAGIVLALAVILSDIAVNWSVTATIGGMQLIFVLNQTAFAAILLATAYPQWRWFGDRARG
jgi:hypothetical protein